MKKISLCVSLLLALAATTLCAHGVQARAGETVVNGVRYTVNSGEAQVVGYTGDIAQNCTIPDNVQIDGVSYPVTAIAEAGLYNCAYLQTISLPSGLKTIGANAFSGCSSLTSCTIPANVTQIGESIEYHYGTEYIGAFQNCETLTAFAVETGNACYYSKEGALFAADHTLLQYPVGSTDTTYTVPDGTKKIEAKAFERAQMLETVTLPDSVETIGSETFSECMNLSRIDFGNGLKTISDNAFYFCNLQSVVLPDTLEKIAEGAFSFAGDIISFEVNGDGAPYFSKDGVLFYRGEYGVELAQYPVGNGQTSYAVPNDVVRLQGGSFNFSFLTEIELPEGLKEIGDIAFQDCRELRFVTIPDSVESMEFGAFLHCRSLQSVSLGTGLQALPEGAFEGCEALTEIYIPEKIQEIDSTAFLDCTSLERITVAAGNTSFCDVDGTLYNKDKTKLLCCPGGQRNAVQTIPASTTNIALGAFSTCRSISAFRVESGNTAFYAVDGVLFQRTEGGDTLHSYPQDKRDKSYEVPSTVTKIAAYAATKHRYLRTLSGKGITEVGEEAFRLSELETIELPALKVINRTAFYGCQFRTLRFGAELTILRNQAIDAGYKLQHIIFTGAQPPEAGWHLLCNQCDALRYVYVPKGTQVEYKSALSGGLPAGALILEGDYLPVGEVKTKIAALSSTASTETIDDAAAGVVRLTKEDAAQLTDEELMQMDELFQNVHADISVTVSDESNSEVRVQGAAVASGLVEKKLDDQTVSGEVEIIARDSTQASELKAYSFQMTVDGGEKELQAPVLLSLTLPQEVQDSGAEILLVHEKDNGDEELIPYTQTADGTVSFRADSFSRYIFCAAEDAPIDSSYITYDTQGSSAALYLAAYQPSGQLAEATIYELSAGQGSFPCELKAGLDYKAILLDSQYKPVGTAAVHPYAK